jgi:hypothetical protein
MRAKYRGWCKAGGHTVSQGDTIERWKGGWSHPGCVDIDISNDQAATERAQEREAFMNDPELIPVGSYFLSPSDARDYYGYGRDD